MVEGGFVAGLEDRVGEGDVDCKSWRGSRIRFLRAVGRRDGEGDATMTRSGLLRCHGSRLALILVGQVRQA